MKNNIFESRKAVLEHLKHVGFKRKFSKQEIEKFSDESTARFWAVRDLFGVKVYSKREDIKEDESWSRFCLDFNDSKHPANRAWYYYETIHFSTKDTETVFGLKKGKEKKQLIKGVLNLLEVRPEVGTYILTLEAESEDFLKLQNYAGFNDLVKDREALLAGVQHRHGKDKVPFDYTTIPSEELPWVIECCGRNPEYQIWEHRQDSAKFWNNLAKNSCQFKDIKDFIK